MIRKPSVAYVTGRRGALARAIAIGAARLQGFDFATLPRSEKARMLREANEAISMWLSDGTLIEFLGEYRER